MYSTLFGSQKQLLEVNKTADRVEGLFTGEHFEVYTPKHDTLNVTLQIRHSRCDNSRWDTAGRAAGK